MVQAYHVYAFNYQKDFYNYNLITYINVIASLIFGAPFVAKGIFKSFYGSQPYVPVGREIEELASKLKPEVLGQLFNSQEQNQRLSYSNHLLKFMQENMDLEFLKSVEIDKKNPKSDMEEIEDENKQIAASNQEDLENIKTGKCSSNQLAYQNARWTLHFFGHPVSPVPRPAKSKSIEPIPVALLTDPDNPEHTLSLEASFDNEYDKKYLSDRTNIGLELRAGDAAVRGTVVADQFEMPLPQRLSLTPLVGTFRF